MPSSPQLPPQPMPVDTMLAFAESAPAAVDAANASTCSLASAAYPLEPYDLPLHIAAIFIIIAISFVGTMLPIAANALLKQGVHGMAVVQHIKLFGVGVILATSLVYKFVPSQSSWRQRLYKLGMKASAADLALHTVYGHDDDLLPADNGHEESNKKDRKNPIGGSPITPADIKIVSVVPDGPPTVKDSPGMSNASMDQPAASIGGSTPTLYNRRLSTISTASTNFNTMARPTPTIAVLAPIPASPTPTLSRPASAAPTPSAHLAPPSPTPLPLKRTDTHGSHSSLSIRHSFLHLDEGGAHAHIPGSLIYHKHNNWRMYIIEILIAVHSLIFGLSLGAAQKKFKVLMIALSFHQFIEGEALSNLVLGAEDHQALALVTVASYTLVTPLGIALGIISGLWFVGTREFLIVEAMLNALSAGMLLYDALVNIMVPHFQAPSFRRASGTSQGLQLTTLWAGVASMVLAGLLV
ncbi:Zinc/iron permease [Entophlyctis helioformis]|nr:Zinc/iron permease [Entophlyctis helioformis]